MPTHSLNENAIQVRVVPRRLRWLAPGTTIAWTKAHACVDALQDFVRNVDLRCREAEQDRELAAGAIARRRTTIGDEAMSELANFRLFEIAERALTANIDALERLSDRDPEQAQMLERLKQALTDLREGIPATRRMVRDRCEIREGVFV